jgi:outer membrane beta-barrel protein
MKRPAICLFVWVAIVGWAATGHAKKGGGKAAAPAPAPAAAADQPADNSAGGDDSGDQKAAPANDAKPAAGAKAGGAAAAPSESLEAEEGQPAKVEEDIGGGGPKVVRSSSTLSWADIVVVPRKRFLKGGRFEIQPFTGMSVNDSLIRHYVFGADLNFYLTDVFWIGVQGQYFLKQLTNQEELVGLEYNRAPTLNQYLYGGSLNFGYVPLYGKFALFNRSIMHWEMWASAGVGVTITKVIPRDPANDSLAFQNTDLTPNVGIGSRFFLFDWLTVNFALRDYIVPDKFEPLKDGAQATPMAITTADEAKANAHSALVNNLMLYVGAGFYLPTKFQYKTPR